MLKADSNMPPVMPTTQIMSVLVNPSSMSADAIYIIVRESIIRMKDGVDPSHTTKRACNLIRKE